MTRTETAPSSVTAQQGQAACSFLGVVDDADTYSLTLAVENYCYKRRPKRSVEPEHQVRFCLAGTHAQCPFLTGGETQPAQAPAPTAAPVLEPALTTVKPAQAAEAAPVKRQSQQAPKTAARPGSKPPTWQTRLVWAAAITGLLAVMATIVYFSFWARMDAQLAGSVLPVQADFVPQGRFPQVLVHVAGYGEDWTELAERYDTTEAVLKIVNPAPEGEELAPGRLLVVLPGITDLAGLGPLFAYWNPQAQRVATAALEYGVSEEHIRFWNQIEGDWVEGQRWLVIGPHE